MAANTIGIDRRSFLRLGAAGAGLALGCGREVDPAVAGAGSDGMRYRPLGATGLEVSEVSFGAHGVDNQNLMAAALEGGITTFATSGQYLDGREEEALGRALRDIGGDHDRLVVLTGNSVGRDITPQTVRDDIDASLRRLGTERIEVYYASDVRRVDEVHSEPFHEAIDEAKRAGKVGVLGISGHSGGMQEVLRAAIDDGRYEVFFIKYDFVSYPDLDDILDRAQERGIGTLVFKTNAGNRQREIKDLEKGGLSYRQATMKWALTHPAVASVCVTITSFDQIREYAAAVGSRLTSGEVDMLRRYSEEMRDRYCRFCSGCEARCPHGVAIADVNRFWMYSAYYDRHEEARRGYGALALGRSAAACERCPGPCDGACPFGRKVRAELVEAHRQLGRMTA
jgi:aryl-alcohol dehydrogenase-like predicted oxidoreductase